MHVQYIVYVAVATVPFTVQHETFMAGNFRLCVKLLFYHKTFAVIIRHATFVIVYKICKNFELYSKF